jgi:hypothetical protein
MCQWLLELNQVGIGSTRTLKEDPFSQPQPIQRALAEETAMTVAPSNQLREESSHLNVRSLPPHIAVSLPLRNRRTLLILERKKMRAYFTPPPHLLCISLGTFNILMRRMRKTVTNLKSTRKSKPASSYLIFFI